MKPGPFEWRSSEVEHRQALQRLDCYPWERENASVFPWILAAIGVGSIAFIAGAMFGAF